ncbi:unnamed protein product [Lactuca virosa]|uniref:Uncharacterized protein n=1 Tax=Lactuca virosa TaxID=75947 RepID=A0AAU9N6L4_9ASTR|nr:unnamed protein product [Lactuca virosa]
MKLTKKKPMVDDFLSAIAALFASYRSCSTTTPPSTVAIVAPIEPQIGKSQSSSSVNPLNRFFIGRCSSCRTPHGLSASRLTVRSASGLHRPPQSADAARHHSRRQQLADFQIPIFSLLLISSSQNGHWIENNGCLDWVFDREGKEMKSSFLANIHIRMSSFLANIYWNGIKNSNSVGME